MRNLNVKQYQPELVVQDSAREFGLDEREQERLREILIQRGVTKALLQRRMFISLKHEVKEDLKRAEGTSQYKYLQRLTSKMQDIAKLPREVVWPRRVHKSMKNAERGVIIRGRRM